MKIKLFGLIAAVMLVGILFSAATPAAAKEPTPIPGTHPIIFVHGGAGSGAQFESQAMRFESNGYPHEYIYTLEYDSTFSINTPADVYAKLDALIASIQEETGADQVDVLGHSLGTTVMIGGTITLPGTPPVPTVTPGYLNSSAERAANVAHYVNIDGRTATALPGTVVGVPVPTLALWAEKTSPLPRQIVGATNVTIPDVTHVQSATCPESFVEMYKFFTGNDPVTSDIVPQAPGQVRLAGRAVLFPLNTGVPSGTLQIWRVNCNTGARLEDAPEAVYPLSGDGSWGPFAAVGGKCYEFNIVREDQGDHPSYYEPFIRSDYLIRLLTSGPTGGPSAFMDRSPNHVNLLLGRNMEFWGDQGAENDVLKVNGTNVISPATNPIAKLVNYMFVYDQGADGVSHLGVPIPYYHALSFFTGVDLFIPGAYPPNGTTSIVLTSRTGGGKTQTINVPNLASSQIRTITVMFHDYSQDINSWPEYVRSR
jgi:pimeloyl-ACP methyl ester carboxylesterase